MRVLVLGSGGREHALCWKIAQSPQCDALFCAPGNPGAAQHATCLAVDPVDGDAVSAAVAQHGIDLVVVGPEAPLVAGIGDRLRGQGVAVFGPSAAAARLEGSKQFAKDFMVRHGVRTAAWDAFTDAESVVAWLADCPLPTVVKADGLAAGKGVSVCFTREEARAAGQSIAVDRQFGAASDLVLVEQFLVGRELSVFALVDGESVVVLQPSRDHKRRFAGDQGPNTGGMGAFTPVDGVDAALMARVRDEILLPVARGMVAEGTPYQGLLYAGLMLCQDGPWVIEFNCRFGDPETQPVLLAMDSDLLPLLAATAEGRLADEAAPTFRSGAALCLVLVSGGYPGAYEKGLVIDGLDGGDGDGDGDGDVDSGAGDLVVFHAGTRRDADGRLVTAGGRVLGVTAFGPTLDAARAKAIERARQIHWTGVDFRDDIARTAATTTKGTKRS